MISRTHSTSAQPLIAPTPVLKPIDLSSLDITPTDELTGIVERFNTFAEEVFNPETPVEPKNPELEMGSTATTVPPSDVPPPQQQEVFNPYPTVDGKERS